MEPDAIKTAVAAATINALRIFLYPPNKYHRNFLRPLERLGCPKEPQDSIVHEFFSFATKSWADELTLHRSISAPSPMPDHP
jgi:hypothetical protein